MIGAAQRMKTMVDDLLALAQVTTDRRPFEWVDLNAVAHDVLEDFEMQIEELGATVKVDRLPSIEADPLQMRQLFQNLISNAMKYRRADVALDVEIRALPPGQRSAVRTESESCELRFVDNGQGFDERFRERIFEPFERLHSTESIPGSGIGLAICRRIVDRHDGRIHARSTRGEGTTFTVTLPLHQGVSQASLNSAML
jgi:signal transduction histidine kinase